MEPRKYEHTHGGLEVGQGDVLAMHESSILILHSWKNMENR